MHSIRIFALVLIPTLFLAAPLGAADPPVPPTRLTRDAVDKRIKEYVDRLWKTQNAEGHWDAPGRAPKEAPDPPKYTNVGGQTALVLLALKAAGEDEQDPRFQKALRWLVEVPINGTYGLGLRAALYGSLKDPRFQKVLHRDGKALLGSLQGQVGMYHYAPPVDQLKGRYGDFSNTQYGILGVWAASDHGFEVPRKYWQLVEQAYLESLTNDGGWAYHRGAVREGKAQQAYGSMTVAGLATCFVIWEKLYILNDRNCRGRANPELLKAIDSGLKWMGKNFTVTTNPGTTKNHLYYYYYGLERVGVASGLKYFDDHDWYKEGALQLIGAKHLPPGEKNLSWALLFLSYGRAPVAFNKLWYDGDWNEHPRDFAMLCKWLSKTYEEHRNWQIMPMDAPAQDFHDAPILAISGDSGFKLSDAEAAKIRTYLDRVGMIFAEAIDNSDSFALSFKRLCLQMYPQLELEVLGEDHPVYSSHFKIKGQGVLQGLHDGVRTVAVFSPREISCNWQRLNLAGGREAFHLGGNLVQYASDGGRLWSKEESYWPADLGKKPGKSIAVGRVVHGPGEHAADLEKAGHVWDPSGSAGWARMDIASRNAGGPGVKATPIDAGRPIDPAAYPIVHLTGIGPLQLTEAEHKNLADYARGGGVLLVDAAGGNSGFDKSFRAACKTMFGENALVPAASIDALKDVDTDGKMWHRHMDRLPRTLRPLQLLGVDTKEPSGGAWNVLYVPYDLTYALNGAPASDPVGLSPESAEPFALALLKWRGK